MTPEEKAKEIIVKYKNILPRMDYQILHTTAKDCAIICVDEILAKHFDDWDEVSAWWNQVKTAIQNL